MIWHPNRVFSARGDVSTVDGDGGPAPEEEEKSFGLGSAERLPSSDRLWKVAPGLCTKYATFAKTYDSVGCGTDKHMGGGFDGGGEGEGGRGLG